MHLQASDQASSQSQDQFLPYQQSQFNHSNKYMFQSANNHNQPSHTKYQKIIKPKEHHKSLNSYHDYEQFMLKEEQKRQVPTRENEGGEEEQMRGQQQDIERLKLLLEKQIQKNKHLEKQLFTVQKQLLDIKSKDKQIKKTVSTKFLYTPTPPSPKPQQIKLIQQQLDSLKQSVQKNSIKNGQIQQLKTKNTKLRKENKRYKAFVEAIAMSLGIAMEKAPPKGVNETWKAWREVFGKMAKEQKEEK